MASTASDVQAQAAVDAWLNSQAVKDMQSSIENAYNAGVAQANASNQQVLNTLNKNISDYQTQYQEDAKSAYINKMQGDTTIANQLARLGLTDSGYGTSQMLQNNSVYSQNLSALQKALAQNIANIDLQKANQALSYESELQGLLADKASQNYDYNKYLATTAEDIRQNAISNALQQQYYNYLYSTSGGSGSSYDYSSDSGISIDGDTSTSNSTDSGYTATDNVVSIGGTDYPVYTKDGYSYYLKNGNYIRYGSKTSGGSSAGGSGGSTGGRGKTTSSDKVKNIISKLSLFI